MTTPAKDPHIELLGAIVDALAHHPEAVEIGIKSCLGRSLLTLTMGDRRDMGRVIGRQGRTAAAMKEVIESVAALNGTKSVLAIGEPKSAELPELARREWPTERMNGLFRAIVSEAVPGATIDVEEVGGVTIGRIDLRGRRSPQTAETARACAEVIESIARSWGRTASVDVKNPHEP